jgi:hypothetical protein
MSQTLQRHHGRTPYGRRRALLVAVLALLAATAFAAPRHLLNGEDRGYLGSDEDRSSLLDGQDRSYLSTDGWPLRGQGAYVLGNGRPAVSPHQQPVPIASVDASARANRRSRHQAEHIAGISKTTYALATPRCLD